MTERFDGNQFRGRVGADERDAVGRADDHGVDGLQTACRRAFRKIMDSEPGEAQMKLFKAWSELAHAYANADAAQLCWAFTMHGAPARDELVKSLTAIIQVRAHS